MFVGRSWGVCFSGSNIGIISLPFTLLPFLEVVRVVSELSREYFEVEQG